MNLPYLKIIALLLFSTLITFGANELPQPEVINLRLSAFTLVDHEGRSILSMDNNGKITMSGKKTARLDRNGFILRNDNIMVAALRHDGKIVIPGGNIIATVDKNGTIILADGHRLTWDNGGHFDLGKPHWRPKIIPNTVEAKKAAAIVLICYLT